MSATRFALVVSGAAALALVAALSGCHAGGAPEGVAASKTTAGSAKAAKQQAAAPDERQAASAAATPKTLAAPTRPCATTDLSVAPAQRHVTEGVQVERFTLTTSTPAGCTLTGPLNLSPKGPLSAQVPGATVDLAVSQQQFPADLDIQPPSTETVPLLPGKSASFYAAWFAASSVVCVQSNGFGFNAPGDTTYTDMHVISYSIGSLCDGVFYVSAVF